jgi:hypothetical protein
MTFYCLYEDLYEGVQLRLDQLKSACEKLGVEFVGINSSATDYSNLPLMGVNDLLYNSARGSQTLESILLNKELTTFYVKNPTLNLTYSSTDWSILHDKAGLLSPKTIFHLTTDRQLLAKYVDYLGGFPIIIKVAGGTRGIGTMKIDSWQNLISTVDYLVTTGDKFILRQFINAKSGCRLMVLGNEVIAGADFAMNENDFRNAVDSKQVKYFKRSFPETLIQTAVKASHLANVEFAGVDFLEDEAGNFYLLEINFPSGFSGLINVCSVDIPFKMVEYLKNKATQQ